jgi:hypothetical protein
VQARNVCLLYKYPSLSEKGGRSGVYHPIMRWIGLSLSCSNDIMRAGRYKRRRQQLTCLDMASWSKHTHTIREVKRVRALTPARQQTDNIIATHLYPIWHRRKGIVRRERNVEVPVYRKSRKRRHLEPRHTDTDTAEKVFHHSQRQLG